MTSWMKCGAAVVMVVVFYVGVGNQATQVERASPTVVPITTTTPAVTTVSPNTIPIVSMSTSPQPASTVVEPWVTETTTTTTTIIFLTSYEPQTELEQMICDPKWEWDCQEAIAVATCESNMNPRAVSPPNTNGTTDRGLFQVNDVWREAWSEQMWSRILTAEINIIMAHHAWKVGKRSWMYWTCQP